MKSMSKLIAAAFIVLGISASLLTNFWPRLIGGASMMFSSPFASGTPVLHEGEILPSGDGLLSGRGRGGSGRGLGPERGLGDHSGIMGGGGFGGRGLSRVGGNGASWVNVGYFAAIFAGFAALAVLLTRKKRKRILPGSGEEIHDEMRDDEIADNRQFVENIPEGNG